MLEANHLSVSFPVYRGILKRKVGEISAVSDVSLSLAAGETVGLVGESGCGKSTFLKALAGLVRRSSGEVRLDGSTVDVTDKSAMHTFRRSVQMVFQDPAESLNSRHSLGQILTEPYDIHGLFSESERFERIEALLAAVGLGGTPLSKYPHEFSGGQRQRIGVARALTLEPNYLLCDEPVSALDVSVQAQLLNLLMDLQEARRLGLLIVAHDLSVVRHISHRVGVMYLGELVEIAPTQPLYGTPNHPYTKALLDAVPVPDPRQRNRPRTVLSGEIPSPQNPPSGCRFRTRCPVAMVRCQDEKPELKLIATDHWSACHQNDMM
jgi:oligopeptide/dipeptide ABC transporter ATP-binding protein